MVRHRCTRCKEDVGEYGIRHKYADGLFCEKCLRELRGGVQVSFGGVWGFFSRVWERITDFVTKPFTHTTVVKLEKEATRATFNMLKAKARDMPPDARISSPQKM